MAGRPLERTIDRARVAALLPNPNISREVLAALKWATLSPEKVRQIHMSIVNEGNDAPHRLTCEIIENNVAVLTGMFDKLDANDRAHINNAGIDYNALRDDVIGMVAEWSRFDLYRSRHLCRNFLGRWGAIPMPQERQQEERRAVDPIDAGVRNAALDALTNRADQAAFWQRFTQPTRQALNAIQPPLLRLLVGSLAAGINEQPSVEDIETVREDLREVLHCPEGLSDDECYARIREWLQQQRLVGLYDGNQVSALAPEERFCNNYRTHVTAEPLHSVGSENLVVDQHGHCFTIEELQEMSRRPYFQCPLSRTAFGVPLYWRGRQVRDNQTIEQRIRDEDQQDQQGHQHGQHGQHGQHVQQQGQHGQLVQQQGHHMQQPYHGHQLPQQQQQYQEESYK